MQLIFPKRVEALHLADYMPEMGDQVLQVWVNPPMGTRLGYLDALREAATNPTEESAYQVCYKTAELLSQGPEETRWTAEEVRTLVQEAAVTDPRFWPWLVESIIMLVEQHRGNIKKN